MKTVTIATCPWSSGFFTFAIACACGVDPIPASFENNPLATPNLIAFLIPAPANPPKTAFVEKALTKIALNAIPVFPMFSKIMLTHVTTYKIAIIGTIFSVTEAILFTPPKNINPDKTAKNNPVTTVGIWKALWKASPTEFAWTAFPINPKAKIHETAKNPAKNLAAFPPLNKVWI